ncbi:MAG: hypothetical protein IJE46_02965 [Clostridia bacterium]|nr:hypothetical protein [Clostridia bacterium]
MRIKETVISLTMIVICVCLIFGAFKLESMFEVPDTKILEADFESGLKNKVDSGVSILEFGNMALENKSIAGKGVKLSGGHLSLNGSGHTKLRDELTFSIWFNISDTTPTDPMLLSRESTSGDVTQGPISIHFSDNYTYFRSDITFKLQNSEYGSYSFKSKELFNHDTIKNEWHNLTVVFEKNILYYYYDGVLSSAEVLPVELFDYITIANNNKTFEIGKGAWGNLLGMIDEVAFYDYAVSKDEALKFYNKGVEKYKNKLVMKLNSDTADLNGEIIEAPGLVEENETIMISADFIVNQMGGKIAHDETDGYGRADITLGSDKISIWVMDTNAVINNKFSKLSVYPIVKDEMVYVPVRFVAEGLGAMVSWNEEIGEVTIYFK